MIDRSRFLLVLGAFMMVFLVPSAGAATAPGMSEEAADEQELSAPVVVDGISLFRVRGVSAFPADKRASRIANRIVALAADPAFVTETIRIEEQGDATVIMAGAQLVMGIYDADTRLEDMESSALAAAIRLRVIEAIEMWRHDRSPERLQRHGLVTLGYTLALVLALWAVARLFRWLRKLNELRVRRRIRDIQIAGLRIFGAQQIAGMVTGLLTMLWVILVVGMLHAYTSSVLVLFPWTRAFAGGLIDLVMDPLRTIGLGLVGSIPDLVFLALIIFIARYILKLIKLYFHSLAEGSLELKDFDPDWALPTYRLVRLLLIAFTMIVAYPYIPGSGSEAFKGISIFVGVVFSLGSSSIISNMIAGYMMTYRRAFKVGDRVLINGNLGDVSDVRMLVTYLRTPKNEIVAVPNSEILNGDVVNYSALAKKEGLILHTTVGIGYETPWRQVEAMLLEAADRTPKLLKEPRPFVLQKTLGDFCITYEINAHSNDEHTQAQQYTQLHRNILDIFNEYGVQIMTPAYEGDPEVPKVVPKEQWFPAPAQAPQAPTGSPGITAATAEVV
jgi:small-conductance mechanosensitive channel